MDIWYYVFVCYSVNRFERMQSTDDLILNYGVVIHIFVLRRQNCSFTQPFVIFVFMSDVWEHFVYELIF
jgi:hypothetical protein